MATWQTQLMNRILKHKDNTELLKFQSKLKASLLYTAGANAAFPGLSRSMQPFPFPSKASFPFV